MDLKQFLDNLSQSPESVQFEDTMAVIEANYEFTPAAFVNGETLNDANQNNGSCKIFAFGLLNQLDPSLTLACFGKFYREDVLGNPDGQDHANIRNFIQFGWQGIRFEGDALISK
ncbi:HopJ type III effector protein [Vibrio europaeus]|uniref:HopJ type III effector protein n=1 Tax=Vibrio europaeus TaxID=300876 RepID=UPI0018A7CB08|nr:HopJ type III effector protein [Vibrio europaeus]MDC5812430.1 HopJ type III effector protein [Vibrio europaeus]MDC5850316.1 HopJ type III effector protein [Vibrio europaeus]MDC5857282.1 HopJ type III effector protein [Vibrio europaeus]QPG33857.1 HopJ type III effector protein [Vibrio europaeus]